MAKGRIILVGAGPGDAELLTLKAARALASADIVMHDTLVSPEVLASVRPETQKIPVGKKGYGPSCRQDDINKMMLGLAREGKCVVRLKGGDPLIFSRAGEEIEALREAGIEVEVIPGITAAQAAAAALKRPLTHRHHARRLQYVTGHDHKGALPEDIDWQALADSSVTTVVYMPKKTLAALSEKVREHGLAPDTPAVAVMDASLPTERIIRGTITDLPARMEEARPEGPVLVLIGKALS